MAILEIKNLSHSFAGKRALDNVSLKMEGSNLTIVGPSGCGKTTLLRVIAGLQRPDMGEVCIDGRQVVSEGLFVEPRRRQVGMIFQNLALWPHLNVGKNITLGLRSQGADKGERKRRLGEIIDIMQMSGYEKKYPSMLSAGEQQRVALARSMVLEPKLLLLDEPFAHLDLSLRREMIRLVKQLEAATVFVTHDQVDAAVMDGTVVVMNSGKIEQMGSWQDISEKPATEFVRGFVRQGTMNNEQ